MSNNVYSVIDTENDFSSLLHEIKSRDVNFEGLTTFEVHNLLRGKVRLHCYLCREGIFTISILLPSRFSINNNVSYIKLFESTSKSNKKSETSLLEKAAEIVNGGRNSDHKSDGPGQSFEKIVPIFNQLTGHNLSVADGTTFMMILKLVRNQIDPKEDHMLDLCGYASINNDIQNEEKKKKG